MALDIFWVKVIGGLVAALATFLAGFLPRINAVRVKPVLLELLNVRTMPPAAGDCDGPLSMGRFIPECDGIMHHV